MGGSWGTAMFCPDNSWAAGFGLKVEFDQGSILDDSALNGVVLKCYDAAGNNVDGFNSVTSTVGGLGSWVSNIYCLAATTSSLESDSDQRMATERERPVTTHQARVWMKQLLTMLISLVLLETSWMEMVCTGATTQTGKLVLLDQLSVVSKLEFKHMKELLWMTHL